MLNYVSIVTELNIFTDLSNEHCTLEFDLGDNVISGDEVIVSDDFIVKCNDMDFSNLEYYLKLHYYYIPADIDNSRTGEIPIERLIKLNEGNNTISFTDYPIYLSGDCELIINNINENGYKTATTQVKLTSDFPSYYISQPITLTAKVTTNGLPITSQTVTFKEGNTTLGTATTNSNGIATYTITGGLTSGNHNLTATYSDYTSKSLAVTIEDNYVFEFNVTGYRFETSKSRVPILYSQGVTLLIDWGDGTTEEQVYNYENGTKLAHDYSTDTTHTIKIYGPIQLLNVDAFRDCTNLTSMVIPSSIYGFGSNCFKGCTSLTSIAFSKTAIRYQLYRIFEGCTSLTSIILNWDSSDTIHEYENVSWGIEDLPNVKFSIPNGTTSLYTAKGYPSDKLVERT